MLRLALFLERVSRRLFATPEKPTIPRFQHLAARQGLDLERPLRAAHRPPSEYVFIPQDEYADEVERLLESV